MAKNRRSSLPGRRRKDNVEASRFSESIPHQRPSERLHHDTVGLEFVSHGSYTYAKQLNKLKSKIAEKRNKTKSKHLEIYENKYDSTYYDLISEIKKLKDNSLSFLKLMPTKDYEGDDGGFVKRCNECDQKERRIWQLEQNAKKFSHIDQTVIDLSRAENKVTQLQDQLDVLTRQLREETSSKEDAIRRLSELAASKLRDNNPNIADLSDTNRPTKLAEKVSELYDNEWTDTFDELETNRYNDREIVDYLLTAFMNIYEECRRITTDGFFEKIQACIEHSYVIPQGSSQLKLSDQLRQQAKDFRKLSAAKHIEDIIDGILDQNSFDYLHKHPYDAAKAKAFIRKCIKLSWLMCVQDPPLVLSTETPMEFSTALFREYTSRGPYVAYVVWPIMYLYEGGPVLSKGVAQGSKQDSRDKITSNRQARVNHATMLDQTSQLGNQKVPRRGVTTIAITSTVNKGSCREQPQTSHL